MLVNRMTSLVSEVVLFECIKNVRRRRVNALISIVFPASQNKFGLGNFIVNVLQDCSVYSSVQI